MTYENLRDTAKVVLRGKFIMINVYIQKKERYKINNLSLYLQEKDKEEQTQDLSQQKKGDNIDHSSNDNNIVIKQVLLIGKGQKGGYTL